MQAETWRSRLVFPDLKRAAFPWKVAPALELTVEPLNSKLVFPPKVVAQSCSAVVVALLLER
jgi:hypothetical protein